MTASRSSSAERQRRLRGRRRRKCRIVQIEVDEQTRERLISRGYLKEWDDHDEEAIQSAAAKALRDSLNKQSGP